MTGKDMAIALWVILLWSFNLIAQKIAVAHLSIFIFSFLRVALVFPLVILFPKPDKKLWQYLLCGCFVWVLYLILIGFGLKTHISAGLSAFVIQLQVLFSIMACFMILGEKPTLMQVIGIAILSLGIYFLQLSSSPLEFPIVGTVLLIGACLAYGIGIALSKKYTIGGTIADVTWLSFVSAGPLLLACFIFEGPIQTFNTIVQMSSIPIMCVLFSVVFGTVWATFLWLRLIHRTSVSSVMPFMLLLPVFANILSSIVLGESLSFLQMIFGGVIILGVVFAQGFHKIIFSFNNKIKNRRNLMFKN